MGLDQLRAGNPPALPEPPNPRAGRAGRVSEGRGCARLAGAGCGDFPGVKHSSSREFSFCQAEFPFPSLDPASCAAPSPGRAPSAAAGPKSALGRDGRLGWDTEPFPSPSVRENWKTPARAPGLGHIATGLNKHLCLHGKGHRARRTSGEALPWL